jgi:hypothetical protein
VAVDNLAGLWMAGDRGLEAVIVVVTVNERVH